MSFRFSRVPAACVALPALLMLCALGTDAAFAHRPTQIAAGGDTSCAIVEDGKVRCWGSNSNGQLGFGLGMGPDASTWSPQFVRTEAGEVLRNVRKVVVGSGAASPSMAPHACAVTESGQLWCWGTNGRGQLGVQDTVDRSRAVRARVDAGTPLLHVIDVSLGAGFTCALLDTDNLDTTRVACWGRNDHGQTGVARSDTPVSTPTTVLENATGQPLKNARSIESGYAHTCALRFDTRVMCWGNAERGQLGDGDGNAEAKTRAVFVRNGNGDIVEHVTTLSVDGWHGCLLRDPPGQQPGRLECWGRNSTGQVGNDSLDAMHASPRAVVGGQGDAMTYMAIPATGNHHACARFAELGELNAVYCWGSNSRGQVGRLNAIGSPSRHALEVPPGDGDGPGEWFFSEVEQLAAGDAHTCALDTAGRVRCWGRNDRGQLGRYDTAGDVAHPVPYEDATVFSLDGTPVPSDHVFADGLETVSDD